MRVRLVLVLVLGLLAVPARSEAVTFKTIPMVDWVDALAAGGGWFWGVGDVRVQRRAASGETEASFRLPGVLDHLVVASDGSAWFERRDPQLGESEIVRMTPAGAATHFPLRTPQAQVTGLTFGPDGNLWFTQTGARRALGRLTPDGLVTEFTDVSADANAVAVAAGRVFFGGVAGALESANLSGVIESHPLEGGISALLADPARSAVWVGSASGRPAIRRLDLPSLAATTFTNGLTTHPRGLALGADGNVWFTSGLSHVGRLTPSGRITEYVTGDNGRSRMTGVAAGPDGALWFIDSGNGTLTRVVFDAPTAAEPTTAAIGQRDVTLSAVVNARGAATTVRFEYGDTPAYGHWTEPVAIGDGEAPIPVTTLLSGLQPGQTLHFRAVATSPVGQTATANSTVTTATEPVPSPAIVVPADPDADGDGHPASVDCDDRAPATHIGARDLPGDKLDQDCDGRDAPFTRFRPRVLANWDNYRTARFTFSVFNRLAVQSVPAGTRVELTCRGKGCAFKRHTQTVKRATKQLVLLKRLKRSRLRRGSVVELRLIRADQIGMLVRWRLAPPPEQFIGCLVPDGRKERKC
jgi:virginiamycin B lyase